MSFEEREHTADIIMHITGDSVEELFSDSVLALMHVMYNGQGKPKFKHKLELTAEDPEELIHDFLCEVLFIADSENFVFSDAEIILNNSLTTLNAVLSGEIFDPDIHVGGMEVKGISYSGLKIVEENNKYMLDILFDV